MICVLRYQGKLVVQVDDKELAYFRTNVPTFLICIEVEVRICKTHKILIIPVLSSKKVKRTTISID